MKISKAILHPYRFKLKTGNFREGNLLELVSESGQRGWGDIAPLPQRNRETVTEAVQQFQSLKGRISENAEESLERLNLDHLLYPSLFFALESALLNLIKPIENERVSASALFMGSADEIMAQAKLRESEGFTFAKLKVSNLSFEDASAVIHQLKRRFRLRVDVNQAWSTKDSLRFFSQFGQEELEYIEDPFQNPLELEQFTHPLAVDEPFNRALSLEQIEELPTLKAIIFKPASQGGLRGYLSLLPWAQRRGIDLILSSQFESDVGLASIAALACRLPLSCRSCKHAIGIGTYHHMEEHLSGQPLHFSNGEVIL